MFVPVLTKEQQKQQELEKQEILRTAAIELEQLNTKLQNNPKSIILLIGTTGAGKSSVVNALTDKNTCNASSSVAITREVCFASDEEGNFYIEPHGLLDGTGISNIVLNHVADILETNGLNLILFVTQSRVTSDLAQNVTLTKQLFPTVPIVIVKTGADGDEIVNFNAKPFTDLFLPQRKVGFCFGTFKNDGLLNELVPGSVARLKNVIDEYKSPKPIFENDLKARINAFIKTTIGAVYNIWKASQDLLTNWNKFNRG